MTRISLQIKSIASILVTATAGVSSGICVKKFQEGGAWQLPAIVFALALLTQISLVFIESKEEEELSLLRKLRTDRSQHLIDENRKISLQIQKETEAGNHESVQKWNEVRKSLND